MGAFEVVLLLDELGDAVAQLRVVHGVGAFRCEVSVSLQQTGPGHRLVLQPGVRRRGAPSATSAVGPYHVAQRYGPR